MFDDIPISIYTSVIGLLLALSTASKPFPPVDVRTGLDSYVEHSSVELATDAATWNGVWQRHMGITPIGTAQGLNFPSVEKPPSVDFDQNEVLVIFGGLASQGGYRVVDSEKTAKEVVVKIEPLPMLGNGRTSNLKANPYAFVMFQRTKLPIVVETASVDQNGNVQWNKVAKVGGVSDPKNNSGA